MAIKEAVGQPIVLPGGKLAPFSPAYRAGDQLFVSGQLAFESDGSISKAGIQEQTALCLAHIDQILTQAGLTKFDVVRVGIWLTQQSHFAEFNKVYSEYFGDHRPARALVISELALPGACVEIDAIAFY